MTENTEVVLREPPLAGDELDTLLGSLERQRRTLNGSARGWTLPGCG